MCRSISSLHKVVIHDDLFAGAGRLYDGHTSVGRHSAFNAGTGEVGIVDNAVAEITDFALSVVVIVTGGYRNFHSVLCLVAVQFGIQGAVSEVILVQLNGATVENQSTFGAVDAGTHGVAALTTDGAEHLADDIVGELHDGHGAVVYRPVSKYLVVGISGDLCGVAGNPAQQVNSVTATADNRVTLRGLPPAGRAGNLRIIVCVLGFNKENLANFAVLNQPDGIVEGGGVTANLTDHQLLAGLLLCFNHSTAVVHRKRHRLLAQYVLAGHQGIYGGLTVSLVVGNDDNTFNIITGQHIVIVCIVIQMTQTEFLIVLMQTGFVEVCQSNQLCIFTLQRTLQVNFRESADADHTESDFSCHNNIPFKYTYLWVFANSTCYLMFFMLYLQKRLHYHNTIFFLEINVKKRGVFFNLLGEDHLKKEFYDRRTEDVFICRCMVDEPGAGKCCGPTVRNIYLLECCTEGYGSVIINDKEFPIEPGVGYALFPGDRVRHTADQEKPRFGYSCVMGGRQVGQAFAAAGIDSQNPYIRKDAFDEILGYMQHLVEISNDTDLGAEFRRTAFGNAILGALLRGVPNKAHDQWLERVTGFIEATYDQPITVQGLAREFSLERNYFTSLFKTKTGWTPSDYLASVRVEKACILLKETDEPIAAVATAVGLDTRNFARIFKRITGKTPREYKQNQ